MANGIRTGDPRGFDKGRSSKLREGSQVWQTPEEGRRTYWLKRCGNTNKDEDNSLKNLNDKNQQASSQKFRQLIKIHIYQVFFLKLNESDLKNVLKIIPYFASTPSRMDFTQNSHLNFCCQKEIKSYGHRGINFYGKRADKSLNHWVI